MEEAIAPGDFVPQRPGRDATAFEFVCATLQHGCERVQMVLCEGKPLTEVAGIMPSAHHGPG